MVQSLDLPELGPRGNRQLKDWERQGSWAWRSRWNLGGLGPYGKLAARGLVMPGVVGMARSPELRRARIGRRTRTRRTRIEEDEEWGYGLTVPRSEMPTIHGACETLGSPHQVWPEANAWARCSRRALLPIETPSEPLTEPPCAHPPNAHPSLRPVACAGHGPARGSGSRPSKGSAAFTWTPVATDDSGGSAGLRVAYSAFCFSSSVSPP